MTVTALITVSGSSALSIGNPRKSAFINCIPCVNGKNPITLCMTAGRTSKGIVAPEKISMGKYIIQPMMLALFVFFAIPPTSKPILKVDIIVNSQLPKNKRIEPCSLIFQNNIAAGNNVNIDITQ